MKIKTKRTLCRVIGFMAFLMMFGIVKGMDIGIMPIGRGAALALTSELVGAALLWKGGVIRWPQ